MAERIRAVVVGVGAMGRLLVPMLLDKGVDVVGAVTRASHAGDDLGFACGLSTPLGVVVTTDPDEAFGGTPVDVALVCVSTYVADLEPVLADGLRRGANVVTSAEEALFPWRTEPAVSARLDDLAHEHGVTLLGTGYQDFFWINEVLGLAGTCQRITRISGESRFNVDDYGPELVNDHFVGLDVAAVTRRLTETHARPSYMQAGADVLAAGLGLTITSLTEQIRPTTAAVDLPCQALETVVPAGGVTGKANVVHAETAEGVTMDLELIGRLYGPGEADVNDWTVEGNPTVHVVNPRPATDVITCSSIVNRIPDVIAAPPGLTTVVDLPPLRYRSTLMR